MLRALAYTRPMPDPLAGSVLIRRATEADLPRVVELIHRGAWGESPENPGPPLPTSYYDAFRAIESDPGRAVMVAELNGGVVGTFQFAAIPNLSHEGRPLAQIESVHVDETLRSRGIGETMLRWAMDESRRRGCFRLQLTSNKGRKDAHRFYERLGFVASHEGMKLNL